MGAPPNHQQLTTRTIARVFFTLVGLAVLLYVLYLVRNVIGLILIAVFLSIALGPAVDFFARRGAPRAAAILGVFLSVGFVIFLIGLVVVPPVVDQVERSRRTSPATSTRCARTRRSGATTTSTTSPRGSRSRPRRCRAASATRPAPCRP
jgi:predicted PurR-regulated permease PerM